MEKRIAMEAEGASPEEITALDLDACKSKKIAGLEAFTKLERLSVMHNELKNLDGLPKLPNLLRLDISENPITEGLDRLVENCPKLERLAICGNNYLKDEKMLEPLKKLESLKYLDIICTPLTDDKEYRKKIFALLPQVKYVDRQDVDGEDGPDSDLDEDDDDVAEIDDDDDDGASEEEDDDEEGEEEEDGEEEEGENGPGLKDLYEGELGDDTEEFEVEEEEEDDDEIEDEDDENEEGKEEVVDEEEDDTKRGKKRKLEDEEDAEKA